MMQEKGTGSPADEVFGVGVDVPEGFLEELMDAIDAVMDPVYPGYRRSFRYYPVTGTWKTMEGSHPYIGSPGEVSAEKEVRLEFVVLKKDLPAVMEAIDRVHPYEEPAVDVYREVPWRSLIPSSRSR